MTPGPQSDGLKLGRKMRSKLQWLVRQHTAAFAVVQRARIILLAASGLGTSAIARQLECSARTVRKWKARFRSDPRVEVLDDAERSGRPSKVTVAHRCELVQLACERVDGDITPFRNLWTYQSLADVLFKRTKLRLSVSEVGRILRFESIRPHRVRQWLKSRDPDFASKAKQVCDLYLKPPEGAVVICVDEKPMQALARKNPNQIAPDGSVRREFEYKRHGTQVLLAGFNITTGRVFGQVLPRRTAKATVSFMNALARRYPNREVHIVWDNLSTHCDGPSERWKRFNERHGGRFHFTFTPIHASWMNQVEIWFSILHRRILKYGDFKALGQQRTEVLSFIRHWNRNERHPFRWTWRSDKSNTGKRAK